MAYKVVTGDEIRTIHPPNPHSHKGQNGRLLIIGGSHLFHSASIWALEIASKIVDLVHYSSVEENNNIVSKLKSEFRNGIIIRREDIESYIKEDDCILIGPGMVRFDGDISSIHETITDLKDFKNIKNEGIVTYLLTKYLLKKYVSKQWIIDAGALQMLDVSDIPKHAILTPHYAEFIHVFKHEIEMLLRSKERYFDPLLTIEMREYFQHVRNHTLGKRPTKILTLTARKKLVEYFSKKFQCVLLLKGEIDIAYFKDEGRIIEGGNAGMTKGGTGDVLAGLIAALSCTNDPFVSTFAGSYINKKAGEELWKTVGPYFNTTDLAKKIPNTMKSLLIDSDPT
jgi:NAD(P)H-hydrate repair Nnr-like enzyme with NAD(P)H-hydrate dehydratase domain